MNIDVFTFVAQIFNFALLVWLLRRFLYRPITEAMARREETIAGRLEKAADERREAEELAHEYRERIANAQEEADTLVAEARRDADELAVRLTEELKAKMEVREREWRQNLERRSTEELRQFRHQIRSEIADTVRQVLRDLADTDLEERLVTTFLRRLTRMEADEVERLLSPADDRPSVSIVTSSELEPDMRKRVETGVRDVFGTGTKMEFTVDEERIAGIELRCHGHRLGWNIGDYVDTLEEAVRDELARITSPEQGGVDERPATP